VNLRPTVSKVFLWRVYLILLALWWTVPAFAQVSTATVMGIVQDASKASIPNASVKLINVQTGTENDATTNDGGGFLLPGVIPGGYTLRIERDGFATTQLNGIVLNVGDTKNMVIRMRVGSVTESVTVDASGLTLNSTDASVSTVVDQKFVANIPLNGRSFQDLISMTPGIVTQSPQAAGENSSTRGDFSVNGQRTESNAFFVDGVSANTNLGLASQRARIASTGSAAGSTALGTTQSLVSVDALREFRVLTSTYSPEYGRTPGGQFTFLTRSGTNSVHGSAYSYYRNDALDNGDWFANSTNGGSAYSPAAYNQADFGGTLGAPIVLPRAYNGRDKSFVFFSYEGLYLAQPTPQRFQYAPQICGTAPDTLYSCGQPPELPSALVPVFKAFPSGGFPGFPEILDNAGNPTGMAKTILTGFAIPAHVNSTSVRVDHTLSPKLSMFFRYGGAPSFGQTRQLFSVTANQVDSQTQTFGATAQLSTTSSNELRLGHASSNSNLNTNTEVLNGPLGYYDPAANLNTALGLPASNESVRAQAYIHIVGVGDSASETNQASASLHQWNVRDTLSFQRGNHLFKFGMDQRRIATTMKPAALSVQFDFLDRPSLAENSASYLVVTKSNPASPILNQFSAFAEDEWKMSKVVTLSGGLRWEVNPPPKGKNGQDAFTVLGDLNAPGTLELAPRGTPLWHTSWYNLAPRLGLAWLAGNEPGKELIVRAGAGVFFDTGNQAALSAFNGIGFTASAHYQNVPVPVTQSQLTFSSTVAPPYTDTTVYAFPLHLQLPYSVQWNLGLEKALDRNASLTISYVGASGHRLLQEQRSNLTQLNPDFGDVVYFPPGLTSSYQSLQMKFQRSVARGTEALASYTWAHALDYGSTDPAFPLKHGNSDLDVRHNLEGAISWDSSKPPAIPFLRRVMGNWGLDGRLIARTGFPVNLSGNFFFDRVTGSTYYSGVNLIPGRPLYLHGSAYPGHRMFNGGPDAANAAFSLPDGASQGDAARNLLRGFDAVQVNAALRQDFHIYERLNVQFKAESFNIVNHPNFGYIDPYLTDLLFGQSTKMLNQSFGASGALYEQGGPRSIQISLKFVF
jgi:hypothetical protein